MKVLGTPISGLKIVETMPREDSRGTFARWYCEGELATLMGNRRIVQINFSRTAAVGAVRGLHFQKPPHAEMKLVRCIQGRVWDIAVDLRKGSPTFLKWHAEELSAKNARLLVIPEGFAHGFQVLDSQSELLYLHTACYVPESEDGIRYNDPCLKVDWPLPINSISPRDSKHSLIDKNFAGICV